MKYCEKCGTQLSDDAVFCNACGHKVGASDDNQSKAIKEGSIFKCPYCGEFLPSDVTHCPTCNHEIRGRKVTSTVKEFYDKYSNASSDIEKCELIKMFPIPNNKEDIREFMFIGSTNFDVHHYLAKKKEESLDSAWLSKIDECYNKAKLLLKPDDLKPIADLYNEIKGKVEVTAKRKKVGFIIGLSLTIFGALGSFISVIVFPVNDKSGNLDIGAILMMVSLAIMAFGIVVLVLSFKGKKTMKEAEEVKKKKEEKRNKK